MRGSRYGWLRRLLLALTLGLSMPGRAAYAAGDEGAPPLPWPEDRAVETRLDPWEDRSVSVEHFLKRTFCRALLDHGTAVARLLSKDAEVVLPSGPPVPFSPKLLGLHGARLPPARVPGRDPASRARAIEAWLSPHVERRRCGIGLFETTVARGRPALVQGRFHLQLASRGSQAGPVQDRALASFEAVSGPHGWRLTRLVFGEVVRIWARRPRFVDVTRAVGLRRTFHEAPRDAIESPDRGSLALADVNGDGALDLWVGRAGRNRLYVSRGGGTWEEAAARFGLDDPGNARGLLFVDLDGDGDEDAVVANARYGKRRGTVVFYERRGARFVRALTLRVPGAGALRSMAAGDIDGDGDLDLHVCNYGGADPRVGKGGGMADLLDDASGAPDLLLVNESRPGHLAFEDRAAAWGVADHRLTLASAFVDLDGDGWQDLVVADDFGHKRIYRNTGAGRFEDVSVRAGPGRELASGMGVDVADVDGDGRFDLYFANMHSNAGTRLARFVASSRVGERLAGAAAGNTLWIARAPFSFVEVASAYGVNDGGWAWGGRILDLDLDGSPELSSPCGFLTTPDLEDG